MQAAAGEAHSNEAGPSNEKPATDHVTHEDQSASGAAVSGRRRVSGSGSAYASPIIRQGHVNEDQDPEQETEDESESEPEKSDQQQYVSIPIPEEETTTKDETIIMSDRDAPKPDLVTSCDSTFESSESRDDMDYVPKQRSADDVETIPEDEVTKPEAAGLPEEEVGN